MNTQNPTEKPLALCLAGPTAVGKTRLAVELVRLAPFEIISVDSAQIYRGMDIGTGKPDAATLAVAPHRLIDIRNPDESYSAAEFRKDALQHMTEIHAAGKIPLLVGGTMLYFKALRDGLAAMPAADPDIRRNITELAESEGWDAVHRQLAAVDPEAAQRIHPNDPQRLQRALEIYQLTGRPMSALHAAAATGTGNDCPFELKFLALWPARRATLHQLIARRFEQMLADGLVDEVRDLLDRYALGPELPAIRSVGYRQVRAYLAGEYDYPAMVEKGIAATRQLAKRQLTWLRSWPDLEVRDSENPDLPADCLKFAGLTRK